MRKFLITSLLLATAGVLAASKTAPAGRTHPYVGMWVTADNHIRQELLPDNRYDEARGTRASAYTGRYEVNGNHIDYWDDSGFTADGRFEGDVLHHGGYLFYREGSEAHRNAVSGAAGSPGTASAESSR
ncbi:hypothetical protein Aab01nite_43860 [Paractinoplanes abujensis]|uniref:Ligand-binding protein with streptavidin-like fold n=1 Tax=Paractinoplanes abujensis TaxID=882441 RepID=A0A7W7FYV3_9ACTN|nr:Atu4866 domain-containing protein [Actinoplanes abujensis]MBB4690024.1 hypothetical protein [Actinoplanes abujensis]GID20796.1 hypothetical protein Aab01nite_43860 [Actinoplanes abujensis]